MGWIGVRDQNDNSTIRQFVEYLIYSFRFFTHVKTVYLEHLYGDRRNMWGLSWAT